MTNSKDRQGPWGQYVDRITGGAANSEIARAMDISDSTIGRWFKPNGVRVSAELVIALARQFSGNAVEALVAAGYVTAEEASLAKAPLIVTKRVEDFSDIELAQEMVRRIEEGTTIDPQVTPKNKPPRRTTNPGETQA